MFGCFYFHLRMLWVIFLLLYIPGRFQPKLLHPWQCFLTLLGSCILCLFLIGHLFLLFILLHILMVRFKNLLPPLFMPWLVGWIGFGWGLFNPLFLFQYIGLIICKFKYMLDTIYNWFNDFDKKCNQLHKSTQQQ